METKEMEATIRAKNNLLIGQTKRIALPEEKMAELRKRYFQLKYAAISSNLNEIDQPAATYIMMKLAGF